MKYRIPCNEKLANDPTIQVAGTPHPCDHNFEIGLLGIINGIVGEHQNGWGYICAVFQLECPDHGAERPEFKDHKEGDICPFKTRLMTYEHGLETTDCQHKLQCGKIVKFKVL
jgi:hypothetical protein